MDWENETPAPVTERGPWIATASGGFWSILDPHPQDVRIRDIAAGLSRSCRYSGQIREGVDFYSVAEHSILMLEWLEDQGHIRTAEDGIRILLHDGSEGYLVDMATPVKAVLPEFRTIENRTQGAIDAAFGVESSSLSRVLIKSIDVRIRMDEREALINEPALSEQKRVVWEHTPDMAGLGVTIQGLSPRQARLAFLRQFLRVCETYPFQDVRNRDRAEPHLAAARALLRIGDPDIEAGTAEEAPTP